MNDNIKVITMDTRVAIDNFARRYFDELKNCKDLIALEHVKYEKNIVPQYYIIRESKHDGTHFFTENLINIVIQALCDQSTCYKQNVPIDKALIESTTYIVGDLELRSEYKGNQVTQTIKLPVISKYIMKEEV